MRALRLVVQYDGTDYAGFQTQPDRPTIQGTLEQVAGEILGHPVRLTAAGRTDAGVHALGQVITLQTDTPLPLAKVPEVFNNRLPADITVAAAEQVDESFHPRFDARRKRYSYRILNRDIASPFICRYAWHVREPLDGEAMAAAAEHLLGEHDFATFCAGGSEVTSTVRTLYSLDVARERDILEIWGEANGFLYQMMRIIVGTLVDVGAGRLCAEEVVQILERGDRRYAGPTAPPHGLCLARVIY